MTKFIYIIILFFLTDTSFGQIKDKVPDVDTSALSADPADMPVDSADLSNLSLTDLSKLKSRYKATDMEKAISQAIEAASHKPLSLRNSPSIISVITEDEIARSGARDFIDLLKLIPGIELNVDVQGVIAISFRGIWANEGNMLLQIDGVGMNEAAYGSLQFGNHYPIHQVKKIEIIRGPGSAMFGGFAEYAVINIITKNGDEMKSVNADLILARTKSTYSRQNICLSAGNKWKKFDYSLIAMAGRGIRSNLTYTDINGTSFAMKDVSKLDNTFIDFKLGYKNLSLLFIYDNYATDTRDGFQNALSKPYPCNFMSYLAELKYNKVWNKKWQFQAKVVTKRAVPWTSDGYPDPVDSAYSYYVIIADRYRANVNLSWTPFGWLNTVTGLEGVYDWAHKPNGQLFNADQANRVNYLNYAPFIQTLIKSRIANVTLGARYDVSTAFGSAINPRLGITKRFGTFNFKLLYASSFRAPSIEAIQFSMDGNKLKPEASNTLEFETSVELSKNMFVSLNMFDITTHNAIHYFVRTDSGFTGSPDGYRNTDRISGSQGFEFEYKYKSRLGSVNFLYSFYSIANKGRDDANAVSLNKNATLGIAQEKFTLMGSRNFGKYIFITSSINFLGRRYAYTIADKLGNGILDVFNPQTVLNLFAGADQLLKQTSFGIGVNNITDERIAYLQPYNSLHAPLPGLGREFYLKFNYCFSFTNKNQRR